MEPDGATAGTVLYLDVAVTKLIYTRTGQASKQASKQAMSTPMSLSMSLSMATGKSQALAMCTRSLAQRNAFVQCRPPRQHRLRTARMDMCSRRSVCALARATKAFVQCRPPRQHRLRTAPAPHGASRLIFVFQSERHELRLALPCPAKPLLFVRPSSTGHLCSTSAAGGRRHAARHGASATRAPRR